jgi:hypothetical protein
MSSLRKIQRFLLASSSVAVVGTAGLAMGFPAFTLTDPG